MGKRNVQKCRNSKINKIVELLSVLIFNYGHVLNADAPLGQSALETKDVVIHIPCLHLLVCIPWSLLTLVQHQPLTTNLPQSHWALSADRRLDSVRANAPYYSVVQWTQRWNENNPCGPNPPDTQHTCIVLPGSTYFGFQRCYGNQWQ